LVRLRRGLLALVRIVWLVTVIVSLDTEKGYAHWEGVCMTPDRAGLIAEDKYQYFGPVCFVDLLLF